MKSNMITRAYQIVADKENYPASIFNLASLIVRDYESLRSYVSDLWGRRVQYQTWIRMRRNAEGKNKLDRTRKASNLLRVKLGPEESNNFHTAKGGISMCRDSLKFQTSFLEYHLDVFECENIERMLRYAECVNQKIHDNSLTDVGFIRFVPASIVSEIILWRFFNSHE